MKNVLIHEVMKAVRQNPGLAKKLKIFAAVAVVGLFITAGLVVWAGISMVSYVASQTQQVINSPVAQNQLEQLKSQNLNLENLNVEKLKAEVPPLPQVNIQGCWQSLQGLMTVQPWLENPALKNIHDLKIACLDTANKPCAGAECTPVPENKANNWGS